MDLDNPPSQNEMTQLSVLYYHKHRAINEKNALNLTTERIIVNMVMAKNVTYYP